MTIPANVAAYFAAGGGVTRTVPPEIAVRLDGEEAPRLRLEAWETALGAAPTARFAVALGTDVATGEVLRVEAAAEAVRPGALVEARLVRGRGEEDLVLFEGRVTHVDLAFGPGGETLAAEAEDAAANLLRTRLGGRRVALEGGGTVHVPGLELLFNPDGRGNAAPGLYDPGTGEPHAVFAADPLDGAAPWMLDEAVAYVVAEAAAGWVVGVPGPSEVLALVSPMPLQDVLLEGRTLGEALDALLGPVGGRWRLAAEPEVGGPARRLELWVPDRAPVVHLAHQPAGTTYDPAETHFGELAVRFTFAEAPRRTVALGARTRVESTFDLVGGWDPALEDEGPDAYSPSRNAAFETVADVFRKWVLNESGAYTGPPHSRGPAPDLSGLFGGPTVPRRRRLRPCLSRDALGRGRGVYAEVSLDGGATWGRLAIAARVLAGECGLYLTADPLPPDYLRACLAGDAQVRVTATLEGDDRLRAEWTEPGAEALPGRTRHLLVSGGYGSRTVAPTSRFAGDAADTADDAEALAALVAAVAEADRRCPVPARIVLPELDLGRRPGVRVAGVVGRPLALARTHLGYQAAPVVRRVKHRLVPRPRTELELE